MKVQMKTTKDRVPQRLIEIEENERLSITVKNKETGEESEVLSIFMPGVLSLTWREGERINKQTRD